MKEQIEEMRKDLIEIFDEEYEKRRMITPDFTAEKMTAKSYRKQEWISVDDRLPEDGETVLTINSESKMEVCFYRTERKGIFQQCGGLVLIFNITHWMPLPEPPKMKGGE